jgi:hypothetical protein
MAVIEQGDRVLIIDRKLFKDDNVRMFVGVVEAIDGAVLRVKGCPFHLNPYEITWTERPGDERLRIVPLSSGAQIYVLSREVDLAKLQLRRSPKALTLTDGHLVSLDLRDWLERL